MADIRITCVRRNDEAKSGRHRGHEQITHFGNDTAIWDRATLVARLDDASDEFWICDSAGRRIALAVVDIGFRMKLVRGFYDNQWTDHLLHLPSCAAPA